MGVIKEGPQLLVQAASKATVYVTCCYLFHSYYYTMYFSFLYIGRLGVKAITCKAKAKDLASEAKAKAKDLTFKPRPMT